MRRAVNMAGERNMGALQSRPDQACDIVLKGGITSGVVYPLALVALAEKYRFSNVGGTSAGAIAAAAAAAAEYGRLIPGAGFERLRKIPDEVGPHLLSLFQPTPRLRPLFDIFVAALKAETGPRRVLAVLVAAICGYWPSALLGLAPGVIIIGLTLAYRGGAGFVLFGVLLAMVGLLAAILLRLSRAANTDLVENDFGLCPGITQPGAVQPAFTDWLAGLIAEAAGRGQQDPPLTFGELAKPPDGAPPIRLAMITTSLMEERPYTLPMPKEESRFVFERSEWAKLFSTNVMSFLTGRCEPFLPLAGERGEYFYFPDPDRLPIIVGARMSLSFPGLISAVPLWRRDFTLTEESERNKLRRCLFSDGGLSSNFPIHFFDRLLPNSPTFAISLDDYDEKRNNGVGRNDQVWLPKSSRSGIQLGVLPFSGLGGFLMRLVYSAKDWQDNLQSTLPGYRERIVHVILRPEQGGLNLTMDEKTIRALVARGEKAGTELRDCFDLDAHRWRRFLVAMARMEETLDEVATAYEEVPGRFGDFLTHYSANPATYKQNPGEVAVMLKRGAELAAIGKDWRERPTIRDGHIPRPQTNLRITPKY
jgi:predicted acylesterase/phospholipase RssA